MKRIGLLSDTHGYWDERYAKYFAECDEIWHAGDIGSPELAMCLNDIRPLRAVYGNIDGGELRRTYTETLRWQCEDASILMTHIGGSWQIRPKDTQGAPCLPSRPVHQRT